MRALAAVLTLAVLSGRHALETPSPASASRDPFTRALHIALGVTKDSPINKIFTCGRSLGPSKCFSALSVWRAEKAFEVLKSGREAQFNLREDVEHFPWEKYSNISEDQLYSQLSEDTEKLLRYRSLSLSIPGYSLELESRGNGTFNVDVLRDPEANSGRSMMKKMYKQFYNIAPLLMIPGLIMSAILPFVLPALKMTTVAVGMLNNMALSGAVFTLLRNNAFNDHYEKKVIYVNEGYKNEKYSPFTFSKGIPLDHFDEYAGSASNVQPAVQPLEQPFDQSLTQADFAGQNLEAVQEAMNTDWINQYYGNAGFSDAGSMGNIGTIGSGGSISSVSGAGSSSNIITVTGAPQSDTKVRRSSKIKLSPYRG